MIKQQAPFFRYRYPTRFVKLIIGLLMFGLSSALNYRSMLGLSPWNVFHAGISLMTDISIDRNNHRQAVRDLAIAKQKMLDGIRIWIAPEGTRSRTSKMGEFKKGGFKLALSAQAIIVPVAIIGSNKILPPDTFDFSINETVEMHVCKPIDTMNYTLKDLPKLMEDVVSEISVAAGFSLHSFSITK